ncbi:MAG: hypothetical protein LBC85_02980 [Fibromonadaceae bacterium]|nr:hypothetical protein [Fibromonadaceae bacterium]
MPKRAFLCERVPLGSDAIKGPFKCDIWNRAKGAENMATTLEINGSKYLKGISRIIAIAAFAIACWAGTAVANTAAGIGATSVATQAVDISVFTNIVSMENAIRVAINTVDAAGGGTVTVTGTYNGAITSDRLDFTIPANVTVSWGAEYTNHLLSTHFQGLPVANSALITLRGSGTFEMIGGRLSATHAQSGHAISAMESVDVFITGGNVFSQNRNAIRANGLVSVNGGSVITNASGNGSEAIYTGGDVTIGGNANISAPNGSDVVFTPGTITMTGGTVSSRREALTANRFFVSGGAVSATNTGATLLNTIGSNPLIVISGAANLTVQTGQRLIAIRGGNLYILGGNISAPDGSITRGPDNVNAYFLNRYRPLFTSDFTLHNLENAALTRTGTSTRYTFTPGQPVLSVDANLSNALDLSAANVTAQNAPYYSVGADNRTVTFSGEWEADNVTLTVSEATITAGGRSFPLEQFTIPAFGVSVVNVDIIPPIPGAGGNIMANNILSESLQLNWTRATDNITLQNQLTYRVFRHSSNLGSANEWIVSGTEIGTEASNINSRAVTGLSPGTSYWFNVIVQDQAGNIAMYTPINIATTQTAPAINNLTFAQGTVVGASYSFSNTSAATGTASAAVPLTWSIASGSLPPGLVLSQSGFTVNNGRTLNISGTPAVAGTYNFTLRVANNDGEHTRDFSITINPGTTETITVINTNNNGVGSLRQAVADITDGGTIVISPNLSGQEITLTSSISIEDTRNINFTIEGNGIRLIGNDFPIFNIRTAHNNITFNNIYFSSTGASGRGINANNNSIVTVNSCIFEGSNSVSGALNVDGAASHLTVNGSTFINNNRAIYASSAFTIVGSVFWGNTHANGSDLYIQSGGVGGISGGYNARNGSVGNSHLFTPAASDITLNASPFANATFTPGEQIRTLISTLPVGYPSIDFNGNPIPKTNAAAGAVQAPGAAAAPTLGGAVTITGNSVFGETLTAVTTGLSSSNSTSLGTLSYQWRRNGTIPIVNATGETYTLTAADLGASISVVVSSSTHSGTVSAFSSTVLRAAQTTAPSAPVMANRTVTSITLANITGAQYRIGTNGAWQTSTTFDNLSIGTSYTFYARLPQTATHFASAVSSAVISTVNAVLTGSVTVSGGFIYGETLTAVPELVSVPEIDNLDAVLYQWRRGGVDILGATSADYTLVLADIGEKITVRVTTANTDGYVVSETDFEVSKAFNTQTPVAPTMLSRTQSSITLNPIPGAEFSDSPFGPWKNETLFEDLFLNTGYFFYARYAETDTHFASEETPSEEIFTEGETPKSSENLVTGVTAPVGAVITSNGVNGATENTITATVLNVSSQAITLDVSAGATWELHSNASATDEIDNKTVTLNRGTNTVWIKVIAEHETTRIYEVTIEFEESISLLEIGGITAPSVGVAPNITAPTGGGDQWTATIAWYNNTTNQPAGDTFSPGTVYRAEITITPQTGLTLTGVDEPGFTVDGASSVTRNGNVVTAVFPTVNRSAGSGSVTMADWMYGETASDPVPSSSTNGTGNVQYFYTGRDGTSYSSFVKPTNAGNYTVAATFAESASHLEYTARDNFTIARKPIAVPALTADDLVYTGSEQTAKIPTGEGYELTDNSATNAGDNYIAIATLDFNHEWDEAQNKTEIREIPWSIAKAAGTSAPDYAAPTNLTATVGQTLADVEGLPPGWAWDEALTTPVGEIGEKKHKATFTPANANYSTIASADWTIKVDDATSINSGVGSKGSPEARQLASSVQTYYTLKGTPLGTTKPTAPGVYLEKHGKYTRKIAVR